MKRNVGVSFLMVWLCILSALCACARPEKSVIEPVEAPPLQTLARPVIVDTDMGFDDVMALLFLLARPDIDIKAITVTPNGLAHGEMGVENLKRLLFLAGRPDIPIGLGRSTEDRNLPEFPETWRQEADSLLMDHLPPCTDSQPVHSALTLLKSVLEQVTRKTEWIALGPLQNVAEFVKTEPQLLPRLAMITVMGGALHVPGNAPGQSAEWNFYLDPGSANIVLQSNIPVTLVPLDATAQVPLSKPFFTQLSRNRNNGRRELLYRLMAERYEAICEGEYDFWDALAAAGALDWSLGTYRVMSLSVELVPDHRRGALHECEGNGNVRLMLGANRQKFESIFLETL